MIRPAERSRAACRLSRINSAAPDERQNAAPVITGVSNGPTAGLPRNFCYSRSVRKTFFCALLLCAAPLLIHAQQQPLPSPPAETPSPAAPPSPATGTAPNVPGGPPRPAPNAPAVTVV